MRIITLSTKKPSFFLSFLAFFISLNYSFAQCPTIVNTSQSFCDSRPTPARVSDLLATDSGGGIRWYLVSTGGTALNASTVLNPRSYYADNNAGTCGVRPKVDVTFYNRPSAAELAAPNFCVDITVANLQQKIGANNIRWYVGPTGGSPLDGSWPIIISSDYYASQFISSSGCETLRSKIRVNIFTTPLPTGDPIQRICSNPSPKISDFIVNINPNNRISWYFPSGVEIVDPSNTLIQEGDVYKVTQTDINCESLGLSVSAIFEDPNNAGTNNAKSFCVSDVPTTPPFDLYDLLGGNPDKTGIWIGDLPTIDGYLGKVDISTLLPGDYYFNYEVSTSTKCAKSTSIVTITVLPLPIVSISSKSQTICSAPTGTPSRIDFEGTPLATVTYTVNGVIKTIVLDLDGEASINTTQNDTYELVSVASSGTPSCSQNQTGSITVTVLPLPTVSLNSPSICPGETATLTATPGIAGTYTYEWEVPSGVTNPGNVASFSTTIAGTYTVAITNLTTGCKSVKATGTVVIKPLPVVSLNSPSICPGETATLTATPSIAGTYTYEWEVPSGVTNPGNVASFPTTIAGTYTVAITNLTTSCKSVKAPGTVTIKPLPVVSLNSPSICTGDNATLTATPSIAGTYTYQWEVPSGVTNPGNVASFPITIAGTYTVAITNLTTGCKSVKATGTVVIKPLPVVSLNSPSICPGETATLTATPSIAGTYTYEWEVPSGVTNPGNVASFPTTIAGTYTIAIINLTTSCKSVKAQGTVAIKPLPVVSLNSPSICPGENATLTATPSIAGTYTYEWEVPSGVTNPGNIASFTTTIAGTYTVAITNLTTSCKSVKATGTVVIKPLPVVSLNSPSICPGETATLTATPSIAGTYTYEWEVPSGVTNPGNVASFPTTIAGTYTIAIINLTTSCKSVKAPGTVTIKPLPVVSLNSPSICTGDNATLTATPSIAGTYTYEWEVSSGVTNPGNVASFPTTIAGTYTVAITNLTTSCKSVKATGTVAIKPLPVVSLNSPSICPGETATLTATPAIAGTYTYEWEVPSGVTNPGNVASFTTTIAGTYTVAITNLTTSCKSVKATGTVAIKPLPVVSLNSPSICPEETATLTATPSIAGTYTYEWEVPSGVTNPGNVASFTTTIAGTYTIAIINLTTSCKSVKAQGTVAIKPLPVVSLNSPSICPGENATLTATPSIAGTYTYEWEVPSGVTNPGNIASFTTTIAGTYTVAITNLTTSCKSAKATGTVTLKPIPTASISTKTPTVCSGIPTRLDFEGTPLATVTYTENGVVKTIQLNSDGEAEVTVNQNSVYNLISVSYDDLASCRQSLTGSLTITVLPLPTVTISTKTPTICSGASARIDFEGTPLAVVTYTIEGVTNTILLDSDGEASLLTNQNSTYTLVSVAYISTPSCIQNQTGSITVTVLPIPTASISTKSPTVCSGIPSRVDFEGTPLATVTYSENGVVKTIQLNSDGEAEVGVNQNSVFNLISVSYDDLASCSQNLTVSLTITVLPLPTVIISTQTPTICSGASANIDFEGTPLALVTYTLDGVTNTILLGSDGKNSLLATQNSAYTLVSVASSGTDSCTKLLTDSVTISINPKPTVSISSSGTACSGNAINVTFTGTPNTNVTYRVNGGAIQNIDIGSTGMAVLNITLTATSTFKLESITLTNPPNCSQSLSEETIISVNQPPVAGSNANLSICSDAVPQDLYLLLGSSAQSGGTWFPALTSGTGFFDPKVDLEGSYVYTVAGTPPCVNDTALVTVTIVPAVNAGSDGVANLCSNSDTLDLKTLLVGSPQAGGTWSPPLTSGSGIFDPSLDLATVYTYTVNGTSSCENATAKVTVSITPGPNAGKAGSTTFCLDSPAKDLFLSLGGTPQVGGTWSPLLASGSGIFDPALDQAGVYSYSFSGSQPCDNDTATVTVTLNPSPDAGEDNIALICSNVDGKDLFAFLKGNPQLGGTWKPALVSGTGLFDPKKDADGEYTYTVGNPFCTPDEAKILVTIIPGPDAGLPGSVTFCASSVPQNLFSSLKGTPQVGGTWTSPNATISSGIFDPKVDLPGVYTYTFEGNQPCDDDTATVTVTVDPIVNAGTFVGIQNVCTSVNTFNLSSLLKDNLTGGTWTDNNNQTVISPIDVSKLTPNTYSYTYTVTNSCGTDNEVIQFVILPNPVLAATNIAVSNPNCKGNNVTVSLSNMVDGTYSINYNLSQSNVLTNQNATVTIASGSGTFAINAAAIPNLGTTRVTFLTITNALTSCTTVINPNVSADFILRPSSNLEDVNLAIADVCEGSDVIVTISGASTGLADGNYQFIYTIPDAVPSSGTTGTIAIASGTGQFSIPASYFVNAASYTLTILSITNLSSGCNNSTEDANASFQVFPLPDATGAILSSAAACLNSSNEVSLTGANAISDGLYDITYELSGVSTYSTTVNVEFVGGKTKFFIPGFVLNTVGNVTVSIDKIISGVSQCDTSGSVILPISFNVNEVDTPILTDKGNEFCKNDNPTIANLSSNIAGAGTIVWYDAATGGNVLNSTDLLEDGNSYFATLKSARGCESTIRLEVIVDLTKCKDILIPDGFSPNGDTVNDEFVIKNIESVYPNFTLAIYNRYGNILYKGNRNTSNWDGTATQGGIKIGETTLPVGVYFYILEYNDGKTSPRQGRLYLSR